jgi:hypothetical protein
MTWATPSQYPSPTRHPMPPPPPPARGEVVGGGYCDRCCQCYDLFQMCKDYGISSMLALPLFLNEWLCLGRLCKLPKVGAGGFVSRPLDISADQAWELFRLLDTDGGGQRWSQKAPNPAPHSSWLTSIQNISQPSYSHKNMNIKSMCVYIYIYIYIYIYVTLWCNV